MCMAMDERKRCGLIGGGGDRVGGGRYCIGSEERIGSVVKERKLEEKGGRSWWWWWRMGQEDFASVGGEERTSASMSDVTVSPQMISPLRYSPFSLSSPSIPSSAAPTPSPPPTEPFGSPNSNRKIFSASSLSVATRSMPSASTPEFSPIKPILSGDLQFTPPSPTS